VIGVDPERMVVHVLGRVADPSPVRAPVLGDHHPGVQAVDSIRILRIGDDLVVVLRARGHVVVHLLPGGAGVGAAEEPAGLLGGLDDRVDGVRPLGRDRQPDATHVGLGQTALQLLPGVAAVGALVDAGARAAVDQRPDVTPPLVGRRVQDGGVAGVHDHVHDAGVLVDLQDQLPGLASVVGPVEPAVAPGTPEGAHGGHVDDIPVGRMYQDLADVHRLLQADVLPVLAAVSGAVDSVAVGDAALAVVLARADPDDVGIGRIDGDAADGIAALVVEDRLPRDARVVGLPDIPRADRDVPVVGIARVDGDVADASRHQCRADAAEFQAGKGPRLPGSLVILVIRGGDRRDQDNEQACEQERLREARHEVPFGRETPRTARMQSITGDSAWGDRRAPGRGPANQCSGCYASPSTGIGPALRSRIPDGPRSRADEPTDRCRSATTCLPVGTPDPWYGGEYVPGS